MLSDANSSNLFMKLVVPRVVFCPLVRALQTELSVYSLLSLPLREGVAESFVLTPLQIHNPCRLTLAQQH